MRTQILALALLAAGLTACTPPALESADEPASAVSTFVAAVPAAIVAVREEVQLNAPIPPPANPADVDNAFAACAVKLITRWEVSGEAAYTKLWQGVYYPGGMSGPTWGIGWDGGHQTRLDNARAWSAHPDKLSLLNTSGVTGATAKQRIGEWRSVRTPYPYAAQVFRDSSLPAYSATTRRAFGPGSVLLPPGARCALTSVVYNRGGQTAGERRREYRVIRDTCIPDQDVACVAAQIRSMKRLWPNERGLRDRRDDEARVALEGGGERDAAARDVQLQSLPHKPNTPARPRWTLAAN